MWCKSSDASLDQLEGIHITCSFFLIKFFNVCLFLRERESRGGGRHRLRSRLQALSCQYRAWCGIWTHEPWDHDLSWSQMLNWLSHPGAPYGLFLNKAFSPSFPHTWKLFHLSPAFFYSSPTSLRVILGSRSVVHWTGVIFIHTA